MITIKNEINFENVKFWLDKNIIHCSFNSKFDNRFHEIEIEQIFVEVLSTFSEGDYKPFVIDLTKVNIIKAFSIYRFISRNSRLKLFVISKSFLVKSFDIKLLFKLYDIVNDGVIPIKISTKLSIAEQFSNEKYLEFNAFN